MAELVERRTCDQKVASSNSDRSGRRNVLSKVNFLFWFLFGIRSTPVIVDVKVPGNLAKSSGGRLHLITHTI